MGYSFEFVIPRDGEGKQQAMWRLIARRGVPTRRVRFCCQELKEFAGANAFCVLGIRWAESVRRKNTRKAYEEGGYNFATNNDNDASRRWSESRLKKRKYMIHPIIEWKDEEVWEYIRERRLPYNPLYDQGCKRVGCLMKSGGERRKELEAMPKFAALYKKAIGRYLEKPETKKDHHKGSVEEYYNWWLSV
jgi:phosphoadenosine phosphosulfate reductase